MDHRFLRWSFLVSAFLLPFVVWPGDFGGQVWIIPKVGFLFLVGLLTAWRVVGAALTPFGLVMGLYLGLVLLSSFRDEPIYAILGNAARVDGILYQISLFLFALLAFWVFSERGSSNGQGGFHSFRDFSYVFLGAAALQSILLLLQRVGLDPVGPVLRSGNPLSMPVGTIGHPGMAAGLLLPGVLLGLGLWVERRRRFVLLLTLLVSLGLGVTVGRAGLLGLVVALGVWVSLRREFSFVLVSGLVLFVAVFGPGFLPDRQGFSKEVANPRTGLTRLVIWKLAWEGIRSMPGGPLLGEGPDAFRVALSTRIPFERLLEEYRLEYGWPEGVKVKKVEPLWTPQDSPKDRKWRVYFEGWPGVESKVYGINLDKAHNLFLDRWLSYGLIAALIWVYLYLGGVVRTWGRGALRQALACTLLGVFVYYLFWFPVPQVEPLHVALIAMAFALGQAGKPGAPAHLVLNSGEEGPQRG